MMANKDKRFKNAIYEQLARIGKAISSPKRLELLDLLAQGERTVEVLAREANLTVANTSRHLQILRKSRFVDAEKEGLFVTYRLANASVSDFLHSIRSLAENRLAELEWIMNYISFCMYLRAIYCASCSILLFNFSVVYGMATIRATS